MPGTTRSTADPRKDAAFARLLELFDGRDAVDYATLVERAGVPPRTLDRELGTLLGDRLLFRWARGLYSRLPPEPRLNAEGEELLMLLRDSDADAHLTGFDVIARYAHQFAYGYTHLVYCHPAHLSGLSAELSADGGRPLPAGRHAHLGGSWERAVVVRGQTHDERRYPVRDHLALPEKAWVDLLREVRRSRLGLDYGELGRILRSMQRAGVPLDKLRTYARNIEQAQLAAGYAA
jgi:hypothetical protein